MSGCLLGELLEDNFVITSSVLVSKRRFMKLGSFSAARVLAEDYDLWLRFAAGGPIEFLNEPLLLYSHRGDSYRSSVTRLHDCLAVAKALRNLRSQLPQYAAPARLRVRRRLSRQLHSASRLAAEEGDAVLQRRLKAHAISLWPPSPRPCVAIGAAVLRSWTRVERSCLPARCSRSL
jgi:hypothetical protein